jgi:adenosylcobinamide kinase / adenosylcobinamide-phosphate guanylyltransferase
VTVQRSVACGRQVSLRVRTLILGGARSGKSAEAERRFAGVSDVLYLATSGERPDDPEWAVRVAAHRARRPRTWRTVETEDVASVLRESTGPMLVDCLTLWLTHVMDRSGAWDDTRWAAAQGAIQSEVDTLAGAWEATTADVIAVSNEVGWGVVPATASGRRFQDEMGRLNQRIAALSDEVLLVVAGRVLRL